MSRARRTTSQVAETRTAATPVARNQHRAAGGVYRVSLDKREGSVKDRIDSKRASIDRAPQSALRREPGLRNSVPKFAMH